MRAIVVGVVLVIVATSASAQEPARLDPYADLRTHAPAAALALSNGGRVVAAALSDGTVRLWRAGTPVACDLAVVRHVALSPDGALLALGGDDGAVRLLRTEGATTFATLSADQAVGALAFSADGALLAAGGGRSVVVWRTRDGARLAAWASPNVWRLSFAPTGDALAIGCHGGLRVRRASDATEVGFQPEAPCTDLAWSPDGRLLATSEGATYAKGGSVRLWSADGLQRVRAFDGPARGAALAFSGDGARLLACGSTGEAPDVRGLAVADGTPRAAPVIDGPVAAFARAPDGWLAVATRVDVVLFEPAAWAEIGRLRAPAGATALAADDAIVVTGGGDGEVRVYDAKCLAALNRVDLDGAVVDLDVDDRRWVGAVAGDGSAEPAAWVWNASRPDDVRGLVLAGRALAIALDRPRVLVSRYRPMGCVPDESAVASFDLDAFGATQERQLQVVDELQLAGVGAHAVTELQVSDSLLLCRVERPDGPIRLWSRSGDQRLEPLDGTCVALSRRRRLIVLGGRAPGVQRLLVDEGSSTLDMPGVVTAVAVGDAVVAAAAGRELRVWAAVNGVLLARADAGEPVHALALAGDDLLIVAGARATRALKLRRRS